MTPQQTPLIQGDAKRLAAAHPKGQDSGNERADRAHGGMAHLSPRLRAVAAGAAILDRLAPRLSTELMLKHFTVPRRKAGRDYRDRLPEGAQRLRLRHGHGELTAWSWGFSGPAVLLVHGWEDNSGSMLGFVNPLLELGYRVCVLDSPGHGLSPKSGTHLLDTSYALERMLRTYGPFHSIVAHSYGAAAISLTLDRLKLRQLPSLALIAPMRNMAQHLDIFASIALLCPKRTERLRQRVDEMLGRPMTEICALAPLQRVARNALIVHDRHDPVIPHATGEQIARTVRGARLVSTSNLGHRRVLKCPNVMRAIIDHHRMSPTAGLKERWA